MAKAVLIKDHAITIVDVHDGADFFERLEPAWDSVRNEAQESRRMYRRRALALTVQVYVDTNDGHEAQELIDAAFDTARCLRRSHAARGE